MYCKQLFQNIFDIFVITWKNVHDLCLSEEDEELEKRRKTIFEFPQNYTNIHNTDSLKMALRCQNTLEWYLWWIVFYDLSFIVFY